MSGPLALDCHAEPQKLKLRMFGPPALDCHAEPQLTSNDTWKSEGIKVSISNGSFSVQEAGKVPPFSF